MSKEQDKKKAAVKDVTETAVVVAAPAEVPVVVVEKKDDAAVAAPAPQKRKFPSLFGDGSPELPPQSEEVSLRITQLDKIEIDKLVTAELRSPYTPMHDRDLGDAGSVLTINGVRVEPWAKGVKGSMNQLIPNNGSFGYDWRFEREPHWSKVRDEERTWDIYIYALQRSSTDYPFQQESTVISDKLSDLLEQKKIYQIVFLDQESRLTIDDKLTMPGRWEKNSLVNDGKPGVAYVMDSELTNVAFTGHSTLQGQTFNNVFAHQVRAIAGDIYRGVINRALISKSSLIGVNSHGETGYGRHTIRNSVLTNVQLSDTSYQLSKTELKDCSFSGKFLTIKQSRLTGIRLSAKQNIVVANTGAHYTEQVCFNSNSNIEVDSIYDLTVMPASERLTFALVNGGESFWLNVNGQDDYGSSTYEVAKAPKASLLQEEDRRGYGPRHWGMNNHPHASYGTNAIEDYVLRSVVQTLGAGEMAETIARHITKMLQDRVGIARSIATVKKLEANIPYVW